MFNIQGDVCISGSGMADILSFLESCSGQKISQDSKRRLRKHVESELSYLSRAASGAGAEVSSNLNHLEAVASLLKLPEISCVVGILQSISFAKQLLSAGDPSRRESTELCTTAVDLVCLFRGEPAWIIASARNPDFVSWDNPGDEQTPSCLLDCQHSPLGSPLTCTASLTSPGSAPCALKVLTKEVKALPVSQSDNLCSQTRRPRLTHDTCLKDRIAGLLNTARGTNQLHRPSKIVLYFARGLQAPLQTLLSESFGAVTCPVLKPVGFEILLNPDPNQERPKQSAESGAQLLATSSLKTRGQRHSGKMAPDSEALAWSLIEGVPSPTLGDVSKGADGVSKEWIVLEEPCVASEKDDLAHTSGREGGDRETVVVSAGLSPNGSGVRGQVMDAVRQLESERKHSTRGRSAARVGCTKRGQLEAPQTAPPLEGSFVAIDGPEGSFESGECLVQEHAVSEVDLRTKSPAALENGWVAVGLGPDVRNLQSSAVNGSSIPGSGDDKEWVALSSVAGLQREALAGSESTEGFRRHKQTGQRVGVQQPGLTTEALGAGVGEWVGVSRSVAKSEQNLVPKRRDRNGTGKKETTGMRGDPNSGLEEVSDGEAEGRTERKGDDTNRLEPARKAEQNEDRGNGNQLNGLSGERVAPWPAQTPAGLCANSGTRGTASDSPTTPTETHEEDSPGLAEGRFRTLNQVPLSERPASWPAGLELVNLDTTALVALVSGITNGAAEALRAVPEQVFRERWKGNAGFMRDQVEAELQYPQLPYLESVTADKALLVTQYVLREFVSIVGVVGGGEEQARAERLLKRCWLISDSPSDRLRSLPPSRAIKARHVAIFGTADAWSCPTLTSNAAFARAVQKQGVPLWVLEHRPSALVGC